MPLMPLFAYFELVLPSRKLVGLKYLAGERGRRREKRFNVRPTFSEKIKIKISRST